MKRLIVDARNGHGKPGRAAADFSPGSAPPGSGRHGSTGEPGLTGEAGQPGGVINSHLVWDGQGGVTTEGTCQGEAFRLKWNPVETEEVLLTARGGDGGRGGRGGRGQDGSRGSRGSDATRYSSGSNGGPGGTGGRGGRAGKGGPSGAGGQVSLSVSSEDSDLLLAVHWDVSAGSPGAPGDPGQGGSGGPGGSGGSSYSWTETESYTDSQGKSQTRTVYRSNSGGSDGPRGQNGATGISAEPGARAADGEFTLTIDKKSFSDRYRLKCHTYELVSGDGDDVFEFGERDNRVIRTVVKNVGPAPSPPMHVHSELSGGPELTPGGEQHPLSTLQENQESVVPDFSFHLAEAREDQLPTIHKVLEVPLSLTPRAFFSRLHRRDPAFENPRLIQLTFPVELRTKPSSTSLAHGVRSKQQWEIVNRSNREFPPPGRKLLVDLSLRGEGAHLRVSDELGQALDLGPEDCLFSDIQAIPPGGCATLTAYLEADESSEPYSKATLTASLRLTPQGGGEPRLIQRNPTQYSVALAHQNRPADVMLVTHHGSSSREVKNWSALLSQLQLTWNVWDVSLHGAFPLTELSDYYRGKLVVVLNTPFLTPHRETILPTDLLNYSEFRRSLAEAGFSFYLLGERSQILQYLVPQPERVMTYSSPSQYLKTADFYGQRANPEVPACLNTVLEKIQISRFFFRGVPQPEYLQKRARWLLEQLKKKLPQQRFLITTIFEPDVSEGWLRTRDCGVLEVRRLPDRDARAVVTRQVYRETGQTSEFLFSSENLLGLFSAQDFDDKLSLLSKLEGRPQSHLEALADAILMDLSEEQMDLRRSDARLNKRKLREALNRTLDFCRQDFRGGAPCVSLDSELGKVLVRIVAGLQFLAEHQMAWWDHRIRFLGGSNDIEVTLFLQKLIDQFLDKNFGHDRIWGSPAARVKIEGSVEARLQELEAQRTTLAEAAGDSLSKKETAVEALVRWELRDYLESDAAGESTVWSQQEMEELIARESEHLRRRAELLAVYAQALEAARE